MIPETAMRIAYGSNDLRSEEAASLADYRICVVGTDSHSIEEIFLECADDNTARPLTSGGAAMTWSHGNMSALS
jgi:hypothetical protein